MTAVTTVSDYRRYYGFAATPFAKTIAPAQAFAAPGHREAVARIRWAVEESAIALVTAETGAGKTLAARCAVADLDASRHTFVHLPNPLIGARGLHHHLVDALGVTPRFHRPALIAQTAQLLARERDERDKRVVVVIDESHLLDGEQFEQVRLLTNDAMDSASHLAIILLGQPSLRRILRRGSYAALDQRIAVRYQLPALPADQAAAYLRHHLAIAGRADPLFADDATAAIAHAARGLPRLIGNLATAALIAGYANRNTIMDHDCALAAIADASTE